MSYFSKRNSAILSVAVLAALLGAATVRANAAPIEIFGVGFTALASANPVGDYTVPGTCATGDTPARMVAHYPVQWPEIARETGAPSAGATILVKLNEHGTLLDESISNSSGNKLMDRTALDVIRSATYAPEVQACKTISGSYLVGVAFVRSTSNNLPSFPFLLNSGVSPTLKY